MEREEFNPAVSIIMAAYNAEKTIGESIESVLRQTFSDWELIVVNDCSKDLTRSIVESYRDRDSRIILLDNSRKSGVSLSRQKALDASKGKWIAILDSDDAWVKDKLDKQLALASETGAKLVFTGSAFMDEGGKLLDWTLHVPQRLSYRRLLKQNLVSNSSVLVDADLYRQHYVVGDNMHEDFAIWLGITKSGFEAFGIDEPLLIYRISASSKSGNKLKAAKMNWNTYRYAGLDFISAAYYMVWYTVKGLIKYSHLKK